MESGVEEVQAVVDGDVDSDEDISDEEYAGWLFGPDEADRPEKAQESSEVKEEEALSEEDEEAVKARSAPQPRLPTAEERLLHDLTHIPFRSWCEHCQRGKANSRGHRRNQRQKVKRSCDGGLDLPIVSMDYMYLEYTYSREKKEEEEKEALEKGMRPILVVPDSRSSAVFAHDVGHKGLMGTSAKCVEQDLKDMGYMKRDVVLTSDQEPAIRVLIEDVAGRRSVCSTVLEHSPVGESASNGAVESSIKSVQGQIRTLKLDLEAHIGKQLLRAGELMPWLIPWAAKLITRYGGGDIRQFRQRRQG